jgi:DNA topoisomerase-1
MKKNILIVESPAKIKTISKFLGPDFLILSTQGHVKDLPPKRTGVTINDNEINIEYEFLDAKKKKLVADIRKAAGEAKAVFLAPDPDREGEIIAWHIANEIEKYIGKDVPLKRITFNEITKSAIENAIKHPTVIDQNVVQAQQARRVLDRWVGYEISPILWRKITKGLSAGRVQSVALRLICERENAIKTFKTEEYWSVDCLLVIDTDKNSTLVATLFKIGTKKAEITNEKTAQQVTDQLKKSTFIIDGIKETVRKRNPLAPFITSTLQQSAYNSLGFSVSKTMTIAQKLYEGMPLSDKSKPIALITYMRTDSVRISDTAITNVRSYIKNHFDEAYLPGKAIIYAKKGKSQDAHEAVRPVDVNVTPQHIAPYVERDVLKLYELIWKRFVACQMTQAEYAQKQITIKANTLELKATGSTLLFNGFTALYEKDEEEGDEKESTTLIPKSLTEKSKLDLSDVITKQHFTQPPARYSEATLVKEMEKAGIGRPSTYATILKTIQARAYTTLDQKKRFVPTDLGTTVTEFLIKNFPALFEITFTASMEEDLDKIASGEIDRDKLLRNFYTTFRKTVDVATDSEKQPAQQTNITCPECNKGPLLIRFGKSGPFLGCSTYPECSFTSNFERSEEGAITLVKSVAPELLDTPCPLCKKPLRRVKGRYGMFTACSGYPACTYIQQEKAPFPCPNCNSDIVKKTFRGSSFWGCSNYPTCRYTLTGAIEQIACPQCKFPYTVSKPTAEGTAMRCPNPKCPSNANQKIAAVAKASIKTTKTVKKEPATKNTTKKAEKIEAIEPKKTATKTVKKSVKTVEKNTKEEKTIKKTTRSTKQ